MSYGSSNKSDRAMSPGSLSEDDRRSHISQQRGALYGEGPFAEGGSGGYGEEAPGPRPGFPGPQAGPAALRGHSPLTYEYGRTPPLHQDAGAQPTAEPARANSNTSPQSNPGSKGIYDTPAAQQSTRTSASSPAGGSPPHHSGPASKPPQGSVAPIGTRPSISAASGVGAAPPNPALGKRATTPLPSPLSQGYVAAGNENEAGAPAAAAAAANAANAANPASAGAEGPSVGLSGWGARPNGWGGKPGLGVQASVWG